MINLLSLANPTHCMASGSMATCSGQTPLNRHLAVGASSASATENNLQAPYAKTIHLNSRIHHATRQLFQPGQSANTWLLSQAN